MNRKDIVEFLPNIYNMNFKKNNKMGENGFSKYQIIKACNFDTSNSNYKKINECIDIGFLKQVNDNPPEYLPVKKEIWSFWKRTPGGIQCKKMIADNVVIIE